MIGNVKTEAAWFVVGAFVMCLAQPDGVVRPASAQVGAQAVGSVEYEYNSQSIDAASLQTKLVELGTAGWDVFSVVSTDGSIDTGGDGKPHVVTQRFEVTSKRHKK